MDGTEIHVNEEAAQALEEAAKTAPTSTEEAQAQLEAQAEAEKAQKERPEWLPEKFKDPADLAKAYAELEAKLGSQSAAEKVPGEEEPEADEKKPEGADEGKEPEEETQEEKVDISAFEAEYAEKGELSEESYAKLEKLGFGREFVDSYKAGQEALAEITTQRLKNAAGGEDTYKDVMTWATTGLAAEEIDKANEIFAGSDVEAAVLKMGEIKAAYDKAMGADPAKRLEGDPASHAVGYRSWAEVMKDMNDPRYKKDPAFRKDVETKLAKSRI
ncbi:MULTISPECIES: capsid assembly protein [unclassified Brucella]|uniref:capsid assembly protein n=1 Tax=unclassified Brucella TaxID=2632610 RepID=UPI0012ADE2AE|nr:MULTISPECIES: hypothetical protein [unclassified Brucella]MRN79462.1 hypothetical protein [Brucella sp. 10RB9210]UWF59802.1 hypothetical protein NYO66_04635 [Brucella sp. 2716]